MNGDYVADVQYNRHDGFGTIGNPGTLGMRDGTETPAVPTCSHHHDEASGRNAEGERVFNTHVRAPTIQRAGSPCSTG